MQYGRCSGCRSTLRASLRDREYRPRPARSSDARAKPHPAWLSSFPGADGPYRAPRRSPRTALPRNGFREGAPDRSPVRRENGTPACPHVPLPGMSGGRHGRRVDLARHHRRDLGTERCRLPVRILGESAPNAALITAAPSAQGATTGKPHFTASDGSQPRRSSLFGVACPAVLSLSPGRTIPTPGRPVLAFARSRIGTRRVERR